jgi:hypothetical protein
MLRPPILARIKQRDNSSGLGVYGRGLGSLKAVTPCTRQAQIIQRGFPPFGLGQDVFHVHLRPADLLRRLAILATVLGTLGHLLAQFGRKIRHGLALFLLLGGKV